MLARSAKGKVAGESPRSVLMRLARLQSCRAVAVMAAVMVAGCSGPDPDPTAALADDAAKVAPAAPAAPAAPVQPRIVVQLGHGAPVVAVRWVDLGRHLASIARDGSLVFWQVDGGVILDHAQVPLDPRQLRWDGPTPPALRFHALDEGATPGTLSITFAGANAEDAARDCPGAHRAGTPWCTYTLDLASRAVRADGSVPLPADDSADTGRHWPVSPDGRLRPEPNHGNGRRGLPDLADEHFGDLDPSCTAVDRCRYGVTLRPTDGDTPPRVFTVDPRSYSLDAELSADGLRLLRVERAFNADGAHVEVLDLDSGRSEPSFTLARAYHQVRWLDEARYLLTSDGYAATDDTEDALAGFPPALVVDAACAARGDCPQLESRWQLRPAADGEFLGLGSLAEYCYSARTGGNFCAFDELRPDDGHETYDPPATGLVALSTDGREPRRLPQDALAGQVITAIETSPDRQWVAVATRERDRADAPGARQVLRVWRMHASGAGAPRPLAQITEPLGAAAAFTDEDSLRRLSFSADGRHLVFGQRTRDGQADLHIIDTEADTPARIVPGFPVRAVAVGTDRVLGLDDGQLLDLGTGQTIARLQAQLPLARAGWIERSHLLWAAAADGTIHFWDAASGAPQLTLHLLAGQRYFALTPEGRYDTNLAADTALVRWLVPDAPWRSLGAQTFMRDYYEPGLYRRLLDCRGNGSCAEAFPPLPAIATLNRVLPLTRITGVQASADGTAATVSIEVREGADAEAANGKTRSGLYNPRLFRNGRLVAVAPRAVVARDDDLAAWRSAQAVPATDGIVRLAFTVPLPSGAGGETQEFSSYAFNEDRIKGETARLAWTRPAVAPRPRRAYVLAIGIDAYDTPRFRLNYAVADARLIASRLETVAGHEVRGLVLAAETGHRVDRATILRALSLLAGGEDREATLAALLAEGIDASALQPATPDDAVIVSFSGHGWANPQGDFFLIPGDGRWPVGDASPDLSTLVSTADLVVAFQAMQAGEIALVIDACHSAASVADGRFKPGPMGDSGLGQLAYDKGLRILAATQADDVALEDARLGQGLLTYALAVDGLGAGLADVDGDRRIRVDEWLGYAVDRLPTLAADAAAGRIGGAARAITFSDEPAEAPARKVQQPALFDFNPRPSPVLLREEPL